MGIPNLFELRDHFLYLLRPPKWVGLPKGRGAWVISVICETRMVCARKKTPRNGRACVRGNSWNSMTYRVRARAWNPKAYWPLALDRALPVHARGKSNRIYRKSKLAASLGVVCGVYMEQPYSSAIGDQPRCPPGAESTPHLRWLRDSGRVLFSFFH